MGSSWRKAELFVYTNDKGVATLYVRTIGKNGKRTYYRPRVIGTSAGALLRYATADKADPPDPRIDPEYFAGKGWPAPGEMP